MNSEVIYNYRYRNISEKKRLLVWKILAEFIYQKLDQPYSVLDPAAGNCEFINLVPAKEKWAIDINPKAIQSVSKDVKAIKGDILDIDLPGDYFSAVFVSNFLEHLNNQDEVACFIQKIYHVLSPGGKICIMGPNYKYCYRNYFDFSDHRICLTDKSVEEHLIGAGFRIKLIQPKFLPLSFSERVPVNSFLLKSYLSMPIIWSLLGKQFLLIAEK